MVCRLRANVAQVLTGAGNGGKTRGQPRRNCFYSCARPMSTPNRQELLALNAYTAAQEAAERAERIHSRAKLNDEFLRHLEEPDSDSEEEAPQSPEAEAEQPSPAVTTPAERRQSDFDEQIELSSSDEGEEGESGDDRRPNALAYQVRATWTPAIFAPGQNGHAKGAGVQKFLQGDNFGVPGDPSLLPLGAAAPSAAPARHQRRRRPGRDVRRNDALFARKEKTSFTGRGPRERFGRR